MLHIIAIDAIIVHDMKINEYSVHFSVYFQRVTPSEKVEIVSTLYFNTAKNYDVHYTTAVSLFCIDILPRLKAGDSYRVQEQDKTPESLRWVPAAGGMTAPLTSQAIRASPALKTFIAPTTSAFS